MTKTIEDFAAEYAQQMADFQDSMTRLLLKRNLIDMDDCVANPALLAEKGLMLSMSSDGDKRTITLSKVLDTVDFEIKPPKIGGMK